MLKMLLEHLVVIEEMKALLLKLYFVLYSRIWKIHLLAKNFDSRTDYSVHY